MLSNKKWFIYHVEDIPDNLKKDIRYELNKVTSDRLSSGQDILNKMRSNK